MGSFRIKGGEVYAMLLEQYSEEYKLECEKKLHEDYEKKIASQELYIQKNEKRIKELEKRNKELEKRIKELEKRIKELEKENYLLKKQLYLQDIKAIIQLYKLGFEKDIMYNCIDETKDNLDDIIALIEDNPSINDEEIYNIIFNKDEDKDDCKEIEDN